MDAFKSITRGTRIHLVLSPLSVSLLLHVDRVIMEDCCFLRELLSGGRGRAMTPFHVMCLQSMLRGKKVLQAHFQEAC